MNKRRSNERHRSSKGPIKRPTRPSGAVTQNKGERSNQLHPHWELAIVAGSHELKLTAECIADVAECLTRIDELSRSGRLAAPSFQRQLRYLSVPVRKLILSGDELILRRCFVPKLHPLKAPGDHEPDLLNHWMGNMELNFTVGSSTKERRASFPTEHSHETVVKPLYGLRRTGERKFELEDPFNWAAEPVKDSRWLNTKVLRVDDITLSAEQLLRMMVNREGAHLEKNEILGLQFAGPVRISQPDPGDEAYNRANAVKFSGLSYLQIFTYLVGVYLVNMMTASMKHIPREVAKYSASTDTWRTIISAPSEPIKQLLHLDRDYGMGAVFQSTGDPERPLKLIGDYGSTSTTTIQLP